jgi:hypothetical protein
VRVGHVGIECLGGGEFEQLYFQWATLGTVATCALQDLAPVVGNKGQHFVLIGDQSGRGSGMGPQQCVERQAH